jgi:LemA protein
VTTGVRQLLALVENYPELRANENVLRLQHQLVETEDDIAKARRYFNAVVRDHNILCQSFPTVLVARLLGFHPNGYFSVDDDERELAPASLQ